jgi:hypothetical protein
LVVGFSKVAQRSRGEGGARSDPCCALSRILSVWTTILIDLAPLDLDPDPIAMK